jgi:hypothetical protein
MHSVQDDTGTEILDMRIIARRYLCGPCAQNLLVIVVVVVVVFLLLLLLLILLLLLLREIVLDFLVSY